MISWCKLFTQNVPELCPRYSNNNNNNNYNNKRFQSLNPHFNCKGRIIERHHPEVHELTKGLGFFCRGLWVILPITSFSERNEFFRTRENIPKQSNKTNKAKIHTIKAVSQSSIVERSKLLIACETTGLRGKKKNKTAIKYCLVFLNVSGVIHIPSDDHEGFSGWHPRVSRLTAHRA